MHIEKSRFSFYDYKYYLIDIETMVSNLAMLKFGKEIEDTFSEDWFRIDSTNFSLTRTVDL